MKISKFNLHNVEVETQRDPAAGIDWRHLGETASSLDFYRESG